MKKNYKVIFDISQTGKNKAGCGFFAHSIAERCIERIPGIDFQFIPHFGDFFWDKTMPNQNPYKKGEYGPLFSNYSDVQTFWHSPNLEKSLLFPDIVHSNNFWCPTQLVNSKLVYTLYDIGFMEYPSFTTEANRIGCFDGVFKASVYADWIIAISEFSKNHFLKNFPFFPEERIEVIYPTSRFSETETLTGRPKNLEHLVPQKFWLCVGTIEPRKNQKFLCHAYAKYLDSGGVPMPLVFAGQNGWLMDDFQSFIYTHGLANQVILTGYVTDEELLWLYQNCYVNLYPSIFEGFGLPVLEAMQFGAATITSKNTPMDEIVMDAGILLASDDLYGWSNALLKLSHDQGMRDYYAQKGKIRATFFNWKRLEKELAITYAKVLQLPKR